MLSTNAGIAPMHCLPWLVNQTALQALRFFFKQTGAHNMRMRPWSLLHVPWNPADRNLAFTKSG